MSLFLCVEEAYNTLPCNGHTMGTILLKVVGGRLLYFNLNVVSRKDKKATNPLVRILNLVEISWSIRTSGSAF